MNTLATVTSLIIFSSVIIRLSVQRRARQDRKRPDKDQS